MKPSQIVPAASAKTRALLLIAGVALIPTVLLARHFAARGIPSVDPSISLERQQNETSSPAKTANAPATLQDDGEVYRTADRLREASALALVAALYAANERVDGREIHGAGQLIAGIRAAGLLPPGISPDAAAMLLAVHSKLWLHFRPDPLAIEVLSFPRSREDGPAVMVRIPALDEDGIRGSVFIADRLGDVIPPPPFAPVPDCVKAGWIDQSFNQTDISQAQKEQLRNWLTTRQPK